MKQILAKYGLYIILALASAYTGSIVSHMIAPELVCNCPDVPPCPDCEQMKVQTLDLSELKRVKGKRLTFTYAPTYSGNITHIECETDTSTLPIPK